MVIRNVAKRLLLRFPSIYRRVQMHYWIRNLRSGGQNDRETSLLARFVSEGETVVDVGAHFGRYVVPLSRLVGPNGKVIAFEPVNATFVTLSKICKRLGIDNVELLHAAVSDEKGDMSIITPRRPDGLESLSTSFLAKSGVSMPTDYLEEKVSVIVLDEIWRLHGSPRVTFLKCDVEGAELSVFRGAEILLRECRPVIECEIQQKHTARFGYVPSALVAYMQKIGYRLHAYDLHEDALIPVNEVSDSIVNYFFLVED